MNQATNVNIVPSYGQRGDLHFSQYDVGRTATINLYAVNEAYTIPVGATVKIQATKPSGLGFDVACTFSGSVVTVVSTETMTEEAGRFPCELRITKDSDVIGTANFMFVVEASPHPDGVIDGDAEEIVNEIKALVLQSEGYALGTQDGVPVDSSSPYYENNSKWYSEHPTGGSGLSDEAKECLLACFENVAWIGNDGQDYYDALENALYPPAGLESIDAVYTQGGTVYDNETLDSLKTDLVVTAHYEDSSSRTVTTYTLSGSLTVGTSTITVSYGGLTDTFTVTVTHLDSSLYNWDFTQSMTDSKQSKEITLTTGYTQNSNGLVLSNPQSLLQFLTVQFSQMGKFTVELDISTFTPSATGNIGCLIVAYSSSQAEGVLWRVSETKWALKDFNNSFYNIADATSSSMFNGKTMKLQCDFDLSNTWKLYCDNTLVKEQAINSLSKTSCVIGVRGYQGTYTGLRIYEGLV